MSKLNVIISGSGVAGSAFAFCLQRAYRDANVTIVERSPSLRLTGASVDIRNSAVDIIKWMGVEQQIRAQTTNEKGVQFVDGNGKEIVTLGATGRTDVQSITSEYEIFRGALAKIFIDPVLERGVQIVYDEYIESYEQHDDGVVVTFAKSKKVEKFDILVAADGLSSKIRGMMLGTKPSEQIYNKGCHAAYFTIKSDLLQGGQLAKWYNTTGGRAIFLRPDPNPAGRTRGHFVNVTWDSNMEARAKLDKALSEGNESYMRLLEDSFHDAGWLAPEILRGMRESDDFYCSPFAQVRSPKLHDDRVVLLGDAGFATPGIGTSLAIMGGYVLAGELLNHPGDVVTALRRYEELMMPFTKAKQGKRMRFQMLNPQTQWGIWIRNTILSFIAMLKIVQLVTFIRLALGFKERKLALPDYQWPAE